jgi:hypothetical protein
MTDLCVNFDSYLYNIIQKENRENKENYKKSFTHKIRDTVKEAQDFKDKINRDYANNLAIGFGYPAPN